MKQCEKCGKLMRVDVVGDLCKACRSVCTCGKPKDYRAEECDSCGKSRKAKIQWQAHRATILQGIRDAGKLRRFHLQDISLATLWQRKLDGRYWTWYWDGDTKHTIYRYQWVWQKTNGPIPRGYDVHHINEDKGDDRIENLELMTRANHMRLHSPKRNCGRWHGQTQPTWACLWCGRQFKQSLRKRADGYHNPLYCSLACRTTARAEGY